MCNDPLPKIYLAKRMVPLHAIVVAFFDTVEGKYHQRAMYNIYNSDAFSKASYNHEKNYRLMMLQWKEWEASCHTLHNRNWSQRRHRLRSGEHQRKQVQKGIQNVPTLLKLVYMISLLYITSVWFQKIWSGS